MKKIYTPIVVLMIMSSSLLAQQIPNANFEDWTFNTAKECDMLNNWRAEYDYFNEDQPVVKSTDAQDGSASMLVLNPTYTDSGVYTNFVYTELTENALVGYYKSTIEKKDSAKICVRYFKGKNQILTESAIYIRDNKTDWTFFQVPLVKSENADSIQIAFYPSTIGKQSKLWIDNISFSKYVGMNTTANQKFSLYPNPATQLVNIILNEDFLSDELAKIQIIDITGKVLITLNRNEKTINTSALQAGIYLVQVSGRNSIAVQNLQIK